MKIKHRFKILFNENPKVNEFMRCCDLFRDEEGVYKEKTVCITWKDGEIVDEQRIKKTIDNIRLAFEKQGYEVNKVSYF